MDKKRALVIVDMQNDFVLPNAPQSVRGALQIIPNLQKVLRFFREKKLPVFHAIREYRADGSDIEKTRLVGFLKQSYCVPNTQGVQIIQELSPIDGEYRIIKNRFSAFMQTELDFILRRLEVQEIVVCGIQYPNCIRATVFDAIALGYDVTLIRDATGAQTKEVAKANIDDMKNINVECITTKEILAMMPKS